MSIITDRNKVKDVYARAGEKGWVIPCFCSENLTTTEAILSAVKEYSEKNGVKNVPITIAMTVKYPSRSQASYYTHTRDTAVGLRLFTSDCYALADDLGYFKDADVLLHLDHVQYDLDAELLESDLSKYSTVMYDASAAPFEKNIALTANYVARRGKDIVIEGACDEIMDSSGMEHNSITTPEKAKLFVDSTNADLIVANLGTEHRADSKHQKYLAAEARLVRDAIGHNIVLHGTSSVPNDQLPSLYSDGICKVNIWTCLERDSSPVLFREMVKNAYKVSGEKTVDGLINEGYLTPSQKPEKTNISHFTAAYRQNIIFGEIKKAVTAYLDMWYKI